MQVSSLSTMVVQMVQNSAIKFFYSGFQFFHSGCNFFVQDFNISIQHAIFLSELKFFHSEKNIFNLHRNISIQKQHFFIQATILVWSVKSVSKYSGSAKYNMRGLFSSLKLIP